jgi:hypothetical protein
MMYVLRRNGFYNLSGNLILTIPVEYKIHTKWEFSDEHLWFHRAFLFLISR